MWQQEAAVMLLDLDRGTLTVYRTDVLLGVMAEGLHGEYCWAVEITEDDASVRIELRPTFARALMNAADGELSRSDDESASDSD